MRYKKITALFGSWTLALMDARRIYDYTYVHVFDIHLSLFLQLDNNLFVEPLELGGKKKQKTHTSSSLQHTSSCMHTVPKHNVPFSHMAQWQCYDKSGVTWWNA